MIWKNAIERILLGLLVFHLTSCAAPLESPVVGTETVAPQIQNPTSTSTGTASPTSPAALTNTCTPTIAATPEPTETATITPLPEGYRIVPNVVGMHYLEARQVLIEHGFVFVYRDVYDLENPFGTIVEQEPPAGAAVPSSTMIFIYRAFQAPGMWVGEKCRSLLLTTTSGKLLFAVWLDEGERYEIKTDFPYGQTSVFDFRMTLLDSFNNLISDHLFFEPEWTAWYVLSLGPYEISQRELDQHPNGVPAGCLWVYPPEE